MKRVGEIATPDTFSFKHTLGSHGWYDLAPLEKVADDRFRCVLRRGSKGEPVLIDASSVDKVIVVRAGSGPVDRKGVLRDIAHMVRLDEDLDDFYHLIDDDAPMNWARLNGGGRMLRSATVWEDLVKSLCTTNCSWSLTRIMVRNLVELLGDPTAEGPKAFPTAESMAERSEAFYRDEIRCGYRAPYFKELAEAVAAGDIAPESWIDSPLPTAELKASIKKVKGVGDYAAENLLKLLGRYDGLALDSWLRAGFAAKHNGGRKCADSKIERHYRRFGRWKGLAIWCDMTSDWFSEQ